MSVVTLSAKNEIVIPRDARDALGLKPGDKLLVVVHGDRIMVLQKPKKHQTAIRSIGTGAYPGGYLDEERDSWT